MSQPSHRVDKLKTWQKTVAAVARSPSADAIVQGLFFLLTVSGTLPVGVAVAPEKDEKHTWHGGAHL